MIKERLCALRGAMEEHGMQAYLVPTSDFHSSEYMGEHFKARAYMSGFTGSAGTLVVTPDEAALFVDGRYFLQAARQIEGTGITLMRMGEPGVPELIDYIVSVMKADSVLGMDGRVVPAALGVELEKRLRAQNASINSDFDLVGDIWANRPPLSAAPAYLLPDSFAGRSCTDKLKDLREAIKKHNASAHVMTALDDIMWLFNIRGSDIDCTPYALSFAVVEPEAAYLFIAPEKLPADVSAALSSAGVQTLPYDDIYPFVSRYAGKRVLASTDKINLALYTAIKSVAVLVDEKNPTQLMKAVKNPVELDNLRAAHIEDGVAVARTMKYVKEHASELTELSAAAYVEARRAEISDSLGNSFETIAGYGPHGAIVHYSATPETDIPLEPRSFLLLDSGGQYWRGTTDITRTFVLGPITEDMKRHFAIVLTSMLNLQSARFLEGASGMNLDVLARAPFWEVDMDYKHGTGHGVGYLSGVHEGPNGFRYKQSPGRGEGTPLQEGMVTTDEPGIYIENGYGIRLENELICRKGEKNEFGQFMYFEPLTFAPIDLDAVDVKYLDAPTRARLNAYHAEVYQKLAPFMDEAERAWLKQYTREV